MSPVEEIEDTPATAPARTGRLGGRGPMLAVSAVVLVAVIAFFVWRSSGKQSTDDAQVDGWAAPSSR